jgi:peptide/nickel transport system permease protein
MSDAGTTKPRKGRERRWLLKLSRNVVSLIGIAILSLIVLSALFAPIITKYEPTDIHVSERFSAPSAKWPMGTDGFGRCIFSRVIYGARISLTVGALVVIATGIFGVVIGLLAGYYSYLDKPLMAIMDGLMAFPALMLGIAIAAATQASQWNVVIALSIVYIPRTARVVRSAVLQNKQMVYVKAARAIGAGNMRIIGTHLFPNSLSSLIVQQTFVFSYAVLAEAGLSFIGVGTPPPAPSWGNIMTEGKDYLQAAPWVSFFPGLILFLSVLSLTLIGDALRDVFDPKQ